MWIGGPVEPERSCILVGQELDQGRTCEGMLIAENLYVSTSPNLLRRLSSRPRRRMPD